MYVCVYLSVCVCDGVFVSSFTTGGSRAIGRLKGSRIEVKGFEVPYEGCEWAALAGLHVY